MRHSDSRRGLTRRDVLKGAAAASVLSVTSPLIAPRGLQQRPVPGDTRPAEPKVPPRRCGFNIHDLFNFRPVGSFEEHDFRWMADWGFDFARVPVAYTLIVEDQDPHKPNTWFLEQLDRAVHLGRRYGVHIRLDLHRAPGYPKRNERDEPYNLWKDEAALDAFCFLWTSLAERYKAIPSSQLSFGLINEPPELNEPEYSMSSADYERVIRAATRAIRQVSPDRCITADGVTWGNIPCPGLKDLGIGQNCHIYVPFELSHYGASWMEKCGADTWPEPVWPNLVAKGFFSLYDEGVIWNRGKLEGSYQPWFDLAGQGVPVHCDEMGVYNKTPHPVVLAWLRDVLEMLSAHDIGWALWNFRGDFGILDSGRSDVDYEDFHGHKLDRKLLSLLQEFL